MEKKREGKEDFSFLEEGFLFFFFNDSKRRYCSIVVILHRLRCFVRDIFTKHFEFMKWDTKAFRTMGLVHIYIYIYFDARHLGFVKLDTNCNRTVETPWAATLNLLRE